MGVKLRYKHNAISDKRRLKAPMVFTIREIKGYPPKCMFAEDCQYYDQDGVVCNEYVHSNPCPQFNKKYRDLRKTNLGQWEKLMEQDIMANTVNEKKIITSM